jgi:hypothetical protein
MSQRAPSSSTRPSVQTLLLVAVVAASVLVTGYVLLFAQSGTPTPRAAIRSSLSLADIPFDGQRAFECLNKLCAIGPRPSGSPGMQTQQKLLEEHFKKLGGAVELQPFRVRHPQTGDAVAMANLIVRWHPERRERILLCAHYDTRPFPDRDPRNPRGTFVGANDGASGTAILMELAHGMSALPGRLGVDFALFDGEEFVFEEGDPYFLGAEHFAREYAASGHPYRYRYGVLLDLVADAQLQIYPDSYIMSWTDTRPLVQQIWNTARRLGVHEFSLGGRYDIRDDHIPLHDIGGIACCDIIDFNYPFWHTEADVPKNCSALTLAKVGWVVQEWLEQAVRK